MRELKKAAARRRDASSWRPTPTARARRSPGTSCEAADLEKLPHQRVVFHEITRGRRAAGLRSIRARSTDKLVDAQQARRILDRLVGYKISPLLWKKVQRGLSAGRVQSVALRMVVEREREINGFEPQEYWTIDVGAGEGRRRIGRRGVHRRLAGLWRGEARSWRSASGDARPSGCSIASRDGRVRASSDQPQGAAQPPAAAVHDQHAPAGGVATPRLHREADDGGRPAALRGASVGRRGPGRADHLHAHRLHPRRGVGPGRGARLHRSASSAPTSCRRRRASTGRRPRARRRRTRRSGPRRSRREPAVADRRPSTATSIRLYNLIWQRFVASQMARRRLRSDDGRRSRRSPQLDKDVYLFRASRDRFSASRASGSSTRSTSGRRATRKKSKRRCRRLTEGERARLLALLPEQHFTQPPPRYTEATLVQGAGGERHRPAQHLRADPLDDPGPRLRATAKAAH